MKTKALLGGSIGLLLVVLGISAAIGAICWTYVFNAWLVFFGKAAVIAWWQVAILGFVPFVGQASIPAAVITWILMMFIA